MKSSIAVIPARGGSKRIPRKNVREFGGKPIIAYSIEAACQSGLFERVIVSTDSPEIAEIARDYGAEVPFLRDANLSDDLTPVNLSDDLTPVSAATAATLKRLDQHGDQFGYVCQLMPNCPLRIADDIVASYKQLIDIGSASQISVVRYGWQNPWWAMRLNEQLELEPLFKDFITQRSQVILSDGRGVVGQS